MAQQAIRETLTEPTDPAAAVISIDPGHGCDQGDGGRDPRPPQQPVQPAVAGAPPARLDVQDVRADRGGGQGHQPGPSYYVSAPFTYKPVADGNCDDGTWWCVKTYDSTYCGWTSVDARDAALGQLRLRAAHARRRARAASPRWRASSACARRSTSTALRALDGSRLDRRLAARHGVGLRDARRRRRLLGADGDPQGACSRTDRGHRGGLGQAEPHARDPGRRRRGR